MKKSLTTGLVILLPIALTIWVISYLFDLFTNPLFHLLEHLLLTYEKQQGFTLLHHEMLTSFLSRIAALVATFFLIVILGFIARRFFFDASLKLFQRLVVHIPIAGTVYRLSKEITKAIFSSDQKTFKETVLTPFPSPETYTIGFVTGHPPAFLKKAVPQIDTTIFIPTAPHPISGYVLFCAKESLKNVNISVEETFKYLISCGVVSPHQ
jgi:uncharacterized membrane protein